MPQSNKTESERTAPTEALVTIDRLSVLQTLGGWIAQHQRRDQFNYDWRAGQISLALCLNLITEAESENLFALLCRNHYGTEAGNAQAMDAAPSR